MTTPPPLHTHRYHCDPCDTRWTSYADDTPCWLCGRLGLRVYPEGHIDQYRHQPGDVRLERALHGTETALSRPFGSGVGNDGDVRGGGRVTRQGRQNADPVRETPGASRNPNTPTRHHVAAQSTGGAA